MNPQNQCSCSIAPKLVFPCSGASDVGALADRSARQIALDGKGRMYCLAGIGGRVEDILANTKAAAAILVIDGCKKECAHRTMELAGFKKFEHLKLADMGFEKGKTPVTDALVRQVADKGAQMLTC